jgi:Ran GTPase-activating protein (RanGAP) involved in mRNA processing and transport
VVSWVIRHIILRLTLRGLSKKVIKHLAPSIQRLSQLHLLDLSGNGYGVDGVLAVGACLSEMPGLVELNVRDNNISRSDVCNNIEYRHQHAWMVLQMYSKREGRVLKADPCVHAVLEERVHLLHARSHIRWQLTMKKAHVVRKSKSTVLAFRWPCRFGQS